MYRKYHKSAGLSLIEVMIGLFILTGVMITVLIGFSQLQALGKKIEMRMIATNLAQQRMEMAMRKPFGNLNDPDFKEETWNNIDQYGDDAGSDSDFRRKTIIAENYSGDSRLTQVTVQISYKSYGYRVGIATVSKLEILKGELQEKAWSPSIIELTTIMIDN